MHNCQEFQTDLHFDIKRDLVDSSIIRVLGVPSGHIYLEEKDWDTADKARKELRELKLPFLTREDAWSVDTYFEVLEDWKNDKYSVLGYQTHFCYKVETVRQDAYNHRDDLYDLKLPMEDKLLKGTSKKLGTFQVGGGGMNVSDPCVGNDSDFKAKQGFWDGYAIKKNAGEWGNRNAVLVVVHKAYVPSPKDTWVEECVVGVDGGMVAFTAGLGNQGKGEWNDGPVRSRGGGGVQCSSGYGDGGYGVYVIRRRGLAVAAAAVFLAPLARYEKSYAQAALNCIL